MANVKEVKELQVGTDGLHLPKTPLRARIAECFAGGMHRKTIAKHLNCSYDYVLEALRDKDVKDHVARVKLQMAAAGKYNVDPREVKEWAELAPMAQAFYDHLIRLGFDVPEKRDYVVGKDDNGEDVTVEKDNPDYSKLKALALQAAGQVVDRTWGKVPQRIDIDELPGGDKIATMTDEQLEYYARELRRGTAPGLARERALRLTEAEVRLEMGLEPGYQEAEILAIEGETEDDEDNHEDL